MFCTTSICAVSRANFITGQYARRHGINGFRTPLTAKQFAESFPGVLRKAGYRTGIIGKWGLGGKMPEDQYDYFKGLPRPGPVLPQRTKRQPGTHLTHKLGDQAIEFLDGCTAKQPFAAATLHEGRPLPGRRPVAVSARPAVQQTLRPTSKIPHAKTATERTSNGSRRSCRTSEARKRWFVRFKNEALFQKSVKDYYRLVAGIDDVVGRIRKKLAEKGFAENTVIIFTSDNGFYLGEHGLAGKWFMHEESIRLPLIIYDPRLPKNLRGRKVDELVLSIDIAPTIEAVGRHDDSGRRAGKEPRPAEASGGRKPRWRQDFFYEHLFKHPRIPQTEGVRTKRWKYTRYISVKPVYEELFDLQTDPHEEHNLAKDSAARRDAEEAAAAVRRAGPLRRPTLTRSAKFISHDT